MMLIYGYLFDNHGHLFDNRWPHFFENVNKLWTTKIFGKFWKKNSKKIGQKNEFFVK